MDVRAFKPWMLALTCFSFKDFEGLTEIFDPGCPPRCLPGHSQYVRPRNLFFGILFRSWLSRSSCNFPILWMRVGRVSTTMLWYCCSGQVLPNLHLLSLELPCSWVWRRVAHGSTLTCARTHLALSEENCPFIFPSAPSASTYCGTCHAIQAVNAGEGFKLMIGTPSLALALDCDQPHSNPHSVSYSLM